MFENITNQIVKTYAPEKILLFGSQSKGNATIKSDIDLCIIVDTNNKRQLLTELYFGIETEKPIDIIVYTPSEWEDCVNDSTSFAHKINKEGVMLYG